jgi:hypothetical protein
LAALTPKANGSTKLQAAVSSVYRFARGPEGVAREHSWISNPDCAIAQCQQLLICPRHCRPTGRMRPR